MENEQNQAPSLSVADSIKLVEQVSKVSRNSHQGADLIDVTKVSRPPVTTKVMLYEYLTFNGLSNDSPLFNKLFDHFGENLKLK